MFARRDIVKGAVTLPQAAILADPILADPILADPILADPILAQATAAGGRHAGAEKRKARQGVRCLPRCHPGTGHLAETLKTWTAWTRNMGVFDKNLKG